MCGAVEPSRLCYQVDKTLEERASACMELSFWCKRKLNQRSGVMQSILLVTSGLNSYGTNGRCVTICHTSLLGCVPSLFLGNRASNCTQTYPLPISKHQRKSNTHAQAHKHTRWEAITSKHKLICGQDNFTSYSCHQANIQCQLN